MPALAPAQLDDLLAYACSLPGASFDVKWGSERVVSIGGKMFLVCGADALSYKVPDEDFLPLSGLPGVRPAPYLARALDTGALDGGPVAGRLAPGHRPLARAGDAKTAQGAKGSLGMKRRNHRPAKAVHRPSLQSWSISVIAS
jgi:hypothetical protein